MRSSTATDLSLPLLTQVLELCVVGVVITDARQGDHPIVYVNPAFEQLTGYSADVVRVRNCRLLQRNDTDQPEARAIQQALQAGREVSATLRNCRKDGTLFLNELTLRPLRDAHGSITHDIGYHHDVTAREAALQQGAQAQHF